MLTLLVLLTFNYFCEEFVLLSFDFYSESFEETVAVFISDLLFAKDLELGLIGWEVTLEELLAEDFGEEEDDVVDEILDSFFLV